MWPDPRHQGTGGLEGRVGRTGKMGSGHPGRSSQVAQDAVSWGKISESCFSQREACGRLSGEECQEQWTPNCITGALCLSIGGRVTSYHLVGRSSRLSGEQRWWLWRGLAVPIERSEQT